MRTALLLVTATVLLAGAMVSSATECPTCVPLDDLTGPAHASYPPGLYPGLSNSPPPAHLALALGQATGVVPRDATGAPNSAGLIGWISIGMSNTNQEFATFERREDVRAARNARLIVVDGAVGGQSADVIFNPLAPYWSIVTARVAAAGLDPDQVQVAWLKEAEGTVPDTTFPTHALVLESHLRDIVRNLRDVYPNLRLCYLSSRIYGGYNSNPARSEPLSYETGFAVRWLIEDQIAGDPALNANPAAGAVEAPVLLWGPYLWANGQVPRASDGLTWLITDYEGDFIHPGPAGEAKVATLLENFFAGDTTAAAWRHSQPGEGWLPRTTMADAYVDAGHPTTNYGSQPVIAWINPSIRSYVMFDISAIPDSVFHVKLSLKVTPDTQVESVQVVGVSSTSWIESAITASTSPPFDGAVHGVTPMASAGTAISLDVTTAVRTAIAAGASHLTFGLRWLSGAAPVQKTGSRESQDAPRLLISSVGALTSVPGVPIPGPGLRLTVGPNPAPAGVSATIELAASSPGLTVDIFDVAGRHLRSLYDGAAAAGTVTIAWDGRDTTGRALPAGLYFMRARGARSGADGADAVAKVLLRGG